MSLKHSLMFQRSGLITGLKLGLTHKIIVGRSLCGEGRYKVEQTQVERPLLEELVLTLPWWISGKLSVGTHQVGIPETQAFLGCTVGAVPC